MYTRFALILSKIQKTWKRVKMWRFSEFPKNRIEKFIDSNYTNYTQKIRIIRILGQQINSGCSFHIRVWKTNLGARGWSQTNFVELWSVSRPRLDEMAIEIWVMCQLTEKLFETSSVLWNLKVRIFVQILGDTMASISEHLRASQRVKTERDLHWVKRGMTFWIFGSNPRI